MGDDTAAGGWRAGDGAEGDAVLPVVVRTEGGDEYGGIAVAVLEGLLRRIGAAGDEFLVVERVAGESDEWYAQTRRDGVDTEYQVEFRDGSADRHYVAWMDAADEVLAFFVGWARDTGDWRGHHAWERLKL
ncbi:hypothetical protein [Yinghuangia seranimata]|uniref:hypothetical protein n=1 Tax=Yinghuangia seranimata TaxID=408067 RepID=UPI00248AD466|nr:hypothetical protein [Yinghuangia seranimata]MDI2131618.1 hypothetical protein [Yinghuangia seranimata]